MCAPNKTKEGKKAFSYLFCTHMAITVSAMVSGRLGTMSRIGFSLSSMNYMLMDSIIEVLYHFNKMLIATKRTADNNILSFSETAHWHILHVTLSMSNPVNFTFSDLWPQQPICDWWTPLIIIFRESYHSMSISRESTSLKKLAATA